MSSVVHKLPEFVIAGGKWRAHLAALLGVALVAILGLLGAKETVARSGPFPTRVEKPTDELVASASMCQTFAAEYPALYRIKVFMATFARRNTGTLIFEVRPALDDPTVLVRQTLDLAQIKDNAYHTFEFASLLGSDERSWVFCLRAPGGKVGNAVGVWGATEDTYEDGEAVFRGMTGNRVQDLAFTLEYRFSFPHTVIAMAKRVAAHKPAAWGETWFYLGLGVVCLTLLYWLVYKLVNEK